MVIVLIGLSSLEAATIVVPSPGRNTIQEAINQAQEGDTIVISPGRYQENLIIDGKSINLESKNPGKAAILDGGNKGPCLILKNGSSGKIQGLIIQNGNAGGNKGEGGGIACYQSNPKIVRNTFRNNVADQGLGGGIFCCQSAPVIDKNAFYNNRAEQGEGSGIFAFRSTPVIRYNTFVENQAEQGEGGAISLLESTGQINDNSFMNNLANQGKDVYLQHSKGNMKNNLHGNGTDPYKEAVFLNQSTW